MKMKLRKAELWGKALNLLVGVTKDLNQIEQKC